MAVRIRGDVVVPGAVLSGATVVVGDRGLIEEIQPCSMRSVDIDATGSLIVPGFIDVHVHGGGGADFMDEYEEAARTVARTHAKFGTTTLFATTLTATGDQIERRIRQFMTVMQEPGEREARIAGIHLEGPYICAAKRGAQPLAPIRPPDWDEMRGWIEKADGTIKLITMAPEMGDSTGKFIRSCVAAGIAVSIGHTNATFAEAMAGIEAGAKHATHLFNAMPPLHHREPGAALALMMSPGVMVELIADGVHLHPAVVGLAVEACGSERVILITDAISGTDMPEGTYSLGGTPAIVKDGTAKFADGTLAGSVLTMNRAFINAGKFAKVEPYITAAMSSGNAARQFGLSDYTGSLEEGKRADLAIIQPISGDVEATMREGEWIFRR